MEYSSLIKKYFGYLDASYGLKPVFENEYLLIFESKCCCVKFTLERTQIFIDIGSTRSKMFDLGKIILFKDPESDFKYSFNPKGGIEQELKRLANLLKKYCDEMLKGDFSLQQALEKFRIKR